MSMDWRVPLADVDYGVEEETAVLKVIRSRWLSMGETTRSFEQKFADYVGARHAIATTNATAALHMACIACGIGQGDEVVLPSLSFVATANAVRYTRAEPVFADLENLDSLNISPRTIQERITKKTRAIIVMHYGGFPCDMPAIMDIARQKNLIVIEDAAHAIGSSLDGKMLGTWGIIGCFSFFANKNMTSGEGGMCVTNDDALAERLRLLRSHGMTSLSWDRHQGHAHSYDVVELGYNYRIDEIRSALGIEQLKKLDAGNNRRRELALQYRENLKEVAPSLRLPFGSFRGRSSHHLMPAILPADVNRGEFMDFLKQRGIQTSIHYPPIHQFKMYSSKWKKRKELLPVTEEAASRQVTLPLFPTMTSEQLSWVSRAISEFFY
jgi:dTDP-4-amino-4,6-dideoxygalactose transaminase